MWMFVVGVLLVGGGSGGFASVDRFPTEAACEAFSEEGLADVAAYLKHEGLEAEKVTAICVIDDGPAPGDPA